jgi:hypothetical protein
LPLYHNKELKVYNFFLGVFLLILLEQIALFDKCFLEKNILPFFTLPTGSAMEGASFVCKGIGEFSQKIRSKKWQGGHFLRAFHTSRTSRRSSRWRGTKGVPIPARFLMLMRIFSVTGTR